MVTGAALQRGLLLHLPRGWVKGEGLVGALPVFIPASQDVDLATANRHTTALLGRGQKAQR